MVAADFFGRTAVIAILLFTGHLVGQATAAVGLAISKRGLLDLFVPASVCYAGLGCFSTSGNFYDLKTRPLQSLPWAPDRIDLKFWLFTRSNTLDPNVIKHLNRASVTGSNYDPRKPTKIIVHGWMETGDRPWVLDMKRALLNYGDFNVIVVDWSKGSKTVYTQATANTRMVGALIARMVAWLETEFGANRENFHIIGHSLGSHVSGYAGERLRASESKQLGRITGLDPAGPYFENTHPEVRLDPTDARFVDVIHTDASAPNIGAIIGLGLMQPVGHIDFYPNGGVTQPGCPKSISFQEILAKGIFDGTLFPALCDHARSTLLFTATVANPSADFQAYECSGYPVFQTGRCLSCSGNRCAQLGIRANEWNPNGNTNVRFWSDTQGADPFYTHHFSVKVRMADAGFTTQSGDISVSLVGGNGLATASVTLGSSGSLEPGRTVQGLVTSAAELAGIVGVNVAWKSSSFFTIFVTPNIVVDRIDVLEGLSQQSSVFCGNEASINSGSSTLLSKC